MESIEAVQAEVVRHLGGLPDAGAHQNLVWGEVKFSEGLRQSLPDGEVPAARAPSGVFS